MPATLRFTPPKPRAHPITLRRDPTWLDNEHRSRICAGSPGSSPSHYIEKPAWYRRRQFYMTDEQQAAYHDKHFAPSRIVVMDGVVVMKWRDAEMRKVNVEMGERVVVLEEGKRGERKGSRGSGRCLRWWVRRKQRRGSWGKDGRKGRHPSKTASLHSTVQ